MLGNVPLSFVQKKLSQALAWPFLLPTSAAIPRCWDFSTHQGGTKVAAPVLGALRNSFTVVQEATPKLNRWGISAPGMEVVCPFWCGTIGWVEYIQKFLKKMVGGETSLTSVSFFVPPFPAGLNRFWKKIQSCYMPSGAYGSACRTHHKQPCQTPNPNSEPRPKRQHK